MNELFIELVLNSTSKIASNPLISLTSAKIFFYSLFNLPLLDFKGQIELNSFVSL